MQREEATLFLKLAESIKIYTSSTISLAGLVRAGRLMNEYVTDFKRVRHHMLPRLSRLTVLGWQIYGASELKPNHHYALHTAPQVQDYGPIYNYWAFLTERLNGLLKTFNLNNWGGGRLEVSMMRAFMRDVFVKTLVSAHMSVAKAFKQFYYLGPDCCCSRP